MRRGSRVVLLMVYRLLCSRFSQISWHCHSRSPLLAALKPQPFQGYSSTHTSRRCLKKEADSLSKTIVRSASALSNISGSNKLPYHTNTDPIPVESVVRNLDVRILVDLDLSGHILSATVTARRVEKAIFSFVTRNQEVHFVRVKKAIIAPKLTYCVSIWQSLLDMHERMLRRVQSYFKRRVLYRCGRATMITVPNIVNLLDESDLQAFHCIAKDGIRALVPPDNSFNISE